MNNKSNIHPWRTLNTELIVENPWAKVRRDKCELPDGEIITDYFYWEGNDFAQIFPLTQNDTVILTRQYKHAVKEVVIELPAGLVDVKRETPLEAAMRELKEETGYAGVNWTQLGQLNVSPAKAATRGYPFLLAGAEKVTDPIFTSAENIETLVVTVGELLDLISGGSIRDASSVATTLLALRSLGRHW